MSREMREGADEAFRAVVTKQWDGREPRVTVHGPYATIGAAKATRTREVGDFLNYGQRGKTASGKIQRTTSEWVDIEEAA